MQRRKFLAGALVTIVTGPFVVLDKCAGAHLKFNTRSTASNRYPTFSCPYCMFRFRNNTLDSQRRWEIDKTLSAICNTWPTGTNPAFLNKHCVCGHPWLKTAGEDYARYMRGETDEQRDKRNKYPSVEEWFHTMKGAA